MAKSNLARNTFILFTVSHSNPSLKEVRAETTLAGTWRQKLTQRPWRRAAYCLASLCLISMLSYSTQPRDATTHSELVTPTSIINQEHCSPGLPTGQSDGSIFSAAIPSSQMSLPCLKHCTTCLFSLPHQMKTE